MHARSHRTPLVSHGSSGIGPRLSIVLIFLLSGTAWVGPFAGMESESSAGDPRWLSEVRKEIQVQHYHFTWQTEPGLRTVEAAWHAPNPAHGFRSYFTDSRISVLPRLTSAQEPDWEFHLSLVAYGRDARPSPIAKPSLAPEANRLEYRRKDLVEWYVNDPRGLEQGFVLHAPPGTPPPDSRFVPGARRRKGDEAYLVLTLDGPLSAKIGADAQSVDLAPRSGGPAVLHYGHLEVIDAHGQRLDSWIEGFAEAGVRGIRLVFDDTEAVYPVTVDPLLQSAAWIVEGGLSGAQMGWSVASAGDVNGDGYDDVIVGAPNAESDPSEVDEGQVFVYYGSASGLDLESEASGCSAGADWCLELNEANASLGVSVAAAGDIDNDGFDDVIVGARYADLTGVWRDRGIAVVFFGSSSGLTDCGGSACGLLDVDWWVYGAQDDDQLGAEVSTAGDVNGDGYDDIVVGAWLADNGEQNEGQVYVFYGSSSGLQQPSGLTAPLAADWIVESNLEGTGLGRSVATAGDVNNDNYDDLIIGAPLWDDLPDYSHGHVSVFHGSATGLAECGGGPCSTSDADWTVNGEQALAEFGFSVSTAGDVNGDGFDDVIVGAWLLDNPEASEGQAFVYLGSATGLDLDPGGSGCSHFADWCVEGDQDGTGLGRSVGTAGDVNGDGFDDVIIGAPYWDIVTSNPTDDGRVWVYAGTGAGLPPQNAWMWTLRGDQFSARLGYSVATAGDVNGDGFDDVIVGTRDYSHGQDREGRVAVYHGAAAVTEANLVEHLGLAPGDDLGTSWGVRPAAADDPLPNIATPEAVSYGPIPGSVLVTTGRVIDRTTVTDFPRTKTGIADVDWGTDDEGDATTFTLDLQPPTWAATLRFTTQYLTNEHPVLSSDPYDTDSATLTIAIDSGAPSEDFPLDDSTRWVVNQPVSHCVNLEGRSSVTLTFTVTDTDASEDSGVLISRVYFSALPFPPDVTVDNDGVDVDTPADGLADYLATSPHDVSLTSGTFTHVVDLLSIPGLSMPFQFSIVYNSLSSREGTLGRKWTHSYDGYVQEILTDTNDDGQPDTVDTVLVRHGAGTTEYFEPDVSGNCCPNSPNARNSLTMNPGDPGSFTLVTRDHLEYAFVEHQSDPELWLLTSVTDPNGNRFRLTYEDDGGEKRIDSVTDTRDQSIAFQYVSGYLTSVAYVWPDEPTTVSSIHFEYDFATDDLVSVTDLNGYTTEFSYDPFGNLLSMTSADSTTIVGNTYEQYQGIDLLQVGDRIVSQRDAKDVDPFDPEAGISYEYQHEALRQIDRLGNAEVRHYDAEGRMVRQIDPSGVLWEFEFDRTGNVVESRRKLPSESRLRTVSRATYDNRNNMLSKTDFPDTCIGGAALGNRCATDADCPSSSCGSRQSWAYDPYDNLAAMTDHLGYIRHFTYDTEYNLLTRTDPAGNQLSDTYTPEGRPHTTTTPRGEVFTCSYDDALGQPTSVASPDGAVVSYAYDDLGRRTSVTDPKLGSTTYQYDAAGRVVAQTDALGNTIAHTYDTAGRPLSTMESNGAVRTFVYTATGRLALETDPLGNTTAYEYDAQDRPASMTDPRGRAVNFEYDAAGRLTRVTACASEVQDPCSNLIEVRAVFDEVGNLSELIDPRGNSIAFDHDLLGRMIRQTNAHGAEITYSYDGRGLLTRQTNARGHPVNYEYDAAGRLTGVDLVDGSIAHTLDVAGNAVATISDRYASVTRAFDVMSRLVERTDEFGNTIRYTHDSAGNLQTLTYSDGSLVAYSYDALNRLVRVLDWHDPAIPPVDPLSEANCMAETDSCHLTSYGYDSVGNPVAVGLPDGSAVTYGYDLAHRLTSISDTNPAAGTIVAANFSLDAAGRRTAAQLTLPLDPQIDTVVHDLTHNTLNQVVTRDSDTYTYDDDGNLIGGVLDGTAVSISYDSLNRLTAINQDTFRYDVDGVRVQSTRDGITRRYVHDPTAELSRLLEEHDENGNLVARYVHGLGLVSRQGPTGQHYRVYHYDSRGSTVALTDENGAITDAYAYGPFGAPAGYEDRDAEDPETANPFRYNGHDGVMDDGNGLYYMRVRYYAPELMRFIQRDIVPTGLTDTQSLGLYTFVKGNPIQYMDPDGRWAGIDDFFVIIGSAIGRLVAQVVDCAIGSGGSFSGDGCGWEDYVGAFVGGAAMGAAGLYTGGVAAGAVGGAVDSLITNGLKAIPGGAETSWEQFGMDFGKQVGSGAAGGIVGGKITGSWALDKATSTGLGQATKSIGIGLAKGSAAGGFKWLRKLWEQPGASPLDRATRPPGSVWNQYADPRSDAWERPAGRSCAEYAWQ